MFAVAVAGPPAFAQNAPLLDLPVDCVLGESCYIQQYVDRRRGRGVLDVGCQDLANDGHKGTDFAIASVAVMDAGVPVLAAATGRVIGLRDGMDDIRYGTPGAPNVDGRECGNGLVLDHGGGWHTQYCHLRKGSVSVVEGDIVDIGQMLGLVGMSGQASFPHLHLSVRHNGNEVDPFQPDSLPECGLAADGGLWRDAPAYLPGGLIAAGLTGTVPTLDSIQQGLPTDTLDAQSGALIAWAYLFAARTGDEVEFSIRRPDGTYDRHTSTLEKDQPFNMQYFGRRAPESGLPEGRYTGTLIHRRGSEELDRKTISASLP